MPTAPPPTIYSGKRDLRFYLTAFYNPVSVRYNAGFLPAPTCHPFASQISGICAKSLSTCSKYINANTRAFSYVYANKKPPASVTGPSEESVTGKLIPAVEIDFFLIKTKKPKLV